MIRIFITCLLLIPLAAFSQTALDAPLPDKFEGLASILRVDHFPNPVLASTDSDEPGTYFWKHTTNLLSPTENITIEEGGAYIFYNDQWNLRVAMTAKEFCKLYKIPKGIMKAGQPYTFVENWRRDSRLYGGWAMWYVIGTTDSGKKVFGVGKLDTVGKLYEPTSSPSN